MHTDTGQEIQIQVFRFIVEGGIKAVVNENKSRRTNTQEVKWKGHLKVQLKVLNCSGVRKGFSGKGLERETGSQRAGGEEQSP